MVKKMNDSWIYKTYQVQYIVEVYAVDQYEQRMPDAEIYYQKIWPSLTKARGDLERISKPHPYVKGRRVSDLCPHTYHAVSISTHEHLVGEKEV